jgi:hypothetical protein
MPHTALNPELPQRWRLRNPSSGREVVLTAESGIRYVDRETGAELEVTGALLPLAPTPSWLPWAVENLRICPACEQLVQRDLNYCPYDGRRLPPLADRPSSGLRTPTGS